MRKEDLFNNDHPNRKQETVTQPGDPVAMNLISSYPQPKALLNTHMKKGPPQKTMLGLFLLLLLSLLLRPHSVSASGIGFMNFSGDVTITNSAFTDNFNAIQLTTTNTASIANKTLGNIWIYSNTVRDSIRHGIRIDLSDSGAITIENNFLDNANTPDTGANSINGRVGIRIKNHHFPSIANNTVQNFGRSGIQLQSISNIIAVGNTLKNNGSQDLLVGDEHFASGLQAKYSSFVNLSDNYILSNKFSGIAAYATDGTIGNGNTIKFNGVVDSGSTGSGGSLENCVIAAGSGGDVRGGVFVRDLGLAQQTQTLELCGDTIISNYENDIAKTQGGTVNNCGVFFSQGNFFASNNDTKIYIDETSGDVDLNCANPPAPYDVSISNSTINAALDGKDPFGIIIVGGNPSQKVTVRNCTIKNAAVDTSSRATVTNGIETRAIGAGIFIANDASPLIYSNYIVSNGWGIIQDRSTTEAGASGIMMRCANPNASIYNNIIASNKSDGLVGRETGGKIGLNGQSNTFRNNGRGGIGIYDGTTSNLEIVNNTIFNNKRGIGAYSFTGNLIKISGNYIYSNTGNLSSAGGIGFIDLASSAPVTIENNIIASNNGWKVGGIGLTNTNASINVVNFNVFSNTISNNKQSGIGIRWAQAFTIRNNVIFSNSGNASDPANDEYYSFGIQLRDSHISSNSIEANIIHSNKNAGIGAYNCTGTIGPNNEIKFNGDPSASSLPPECIDVGLGGTGGISAKGLITANLYAETNTLASNYPKNAQHGSGSTYDFIVNGQVITPTFMDKDSAVVFVNSRNKVFVNGEFYSDTPIIDGVADPTNFANISDGLKVWGIAVAGGASGVTIKNCNVFQNNTTANTLGPGGTNLGGGIFVGPNADAMIYSNTVYNNSDPGAAMPTQGEGGTAGIVMRCNSPDVTLRNNNVIANNGDGISIKDSSAMIGGVNAANSVINNGRMGIGMTGNGDPVFGYNFIFSNANGGIGLFSITNSVQIYSNYIYSNIGKDNPGGVGVVSMNNATATIRNNVVLQNISERLNDAPWGIGVAMSNGGSVYIDNNVVASNGREQGATLVGGIGIQGPSAIIPGSLDNLYITSNRISHHGKKRAAIAFKWYKGPAVIRNNRKDGLGLYANGEGIRFQELAEGTTVTISNNIFLDNNNIFSEGGSGLEFKNCSFVNVEIDNNLMSHNTWNTGDSPRKSVISFEYSQQYSSNFIKIRRNTIKNSNNKGIIFRDIDGNSGLDMAYVSLFSNEIYSNIGGMGIFDLSDAQVNVEGNSIYKNQSSDMGGLGLSTTNGTFSFMNNSIFSNTNTGSGPGGMGFYELNTLITIQLEGNSVYNNFGWKVGGIGFTNNNAADLSTVTLYSNAIFRNRQSGIAIWNGSLLNIQNNKISSNGWAGTQDVGNDEFYGSGIMTRNASFGNSNISNNTITSNWFAGIALYSSIGSVGENNTIMYNGVSGGGSGGGSMENCVVVGGSAGDIRGGILAKGLGGADEITIACVNDIIDNYETDYAKTGGGTLRSCTNVATSFFASKTDAAFYLDDTSGAVADLDCAAPTAEQLAIYNIQDSTINAENKKFGIIVVGNGANTTIKNCTIKNAAMDTANRATVTNAGETRYFGTGIFITNNASPIIYSNYIFSNGWGVIQDDDPNEAGASGIQMRCADANTSIYNNMIVSNRSDGIVVRESGGIIGLSNQGNTFRNNGRGGIGIKDGTTRNLTITYNTITNNKRGIGAIGFDGSVLTIANNVISSNQGEQLASTNQGGAIGFSLGNLNLRIYSNTIRNNSSSTLLNQGSAGIGIADCTLMNNLAITDNYLFSNTWGYMGGVGFQDIYSSNAVSISLVNNKLLNNGWGKESGGAGTAGAKSGGVGNLSLSGTVSWFVDNNIINDNKGFENGAFGILNGGGVLTFTNNTVANNRVYKYDTVVPQSYVGPGLGLKDSTTALYVDNCFFSDNDSVNTLGIADMGGALGVYWQSDPGGNIPYLIFKNNRLNHNGDYGGLSLNGPRFSLTSGILVSNNVFSETSISIFSVQGDQSGNDFTPVIISKNTLINPSNIGKGGMGTGLLGAAIGIKATRSFDNKIRQNTIDDNIISSSYPSSSYGITKQLYAGRVTIYNNSITNMRGAGLLISRPEGPDLNAEYARIYSNYLYNNGWGDIRVGEAAMDRYSHGIGVNGPIADNTSFSIENNTIDSNLHYGIGFYSVTNATVLNNTISNNARGGIGFSNPSDPITTGDIKISQNLIYSNTSLLTQGVGGIGIYQATSANVNFTISENTLRNNVGLRGGGIGFDTVAANISIMNNTIFSNEGTATGLGGIGLLDVDTAATVRIEGNSVYNNIGWRAAGIGITNTNSTNLTGVDIYSNAILHNKQGGLGIWNSSLVNIQNNKIFSNGWSGTVNQGDQQVYGSGIQLRNASFANTNITNNYIRSNWFAGISAYTTVGSVGDNNTIVYNGIWTSNPITGGGGMQDCEVAAASAGDIRGGVLVKDLGSGELTLACNNGIYSNYYNDLGQTGSGTLSSCGNTVNAFFASSADTVFYFDASSGHVELNCAQSGNNDPYYPHNGLVSVDGVIDAATAKGSPVPFGIIIVGGGSDVTITNCSIKNAAMNEASRATVTNNGETRYIGTGIFITNDANPSIANNTLYSNGWGILDDSSYTSGPAGASGIQMRCAGDATTIINNTFVNNKNDGIVIRESGGIIGLVNQGNTFFNNGRGGIGIYDGTTRNMEIGYNVIYSNQRGIGIIDFDGTFLNIANNKIYSNVGNLSSPGAIGFKNLAAASTNTAVTIQNNIITSNSGWKVGGIGLTSGNPAATVVNFNIFSNTIANNQQSGIGVEWAEDFIIRNNVIFSNGLQDSGYSDEHYAFGIQVRNSSFYNNSIQANSIRNNKFAGIGAYTVGGTIGPNNVIQSNGQSSGGGLCVGIGGSGRGGISARDLTETLYAQGNTITGNIPKEVQLNPASTEVFINEGSTVLNTYWTDSDVGLKITSDTTINGEIFSNNTVWGVTVIGPYSVTIKNSTIKNNCTNSGDCNITGENGQTVGGGVLIAGGAKVYLDSNMIFSNGVNAKSIGNGGFAGVAVRCADSDTVLVNNVIENNENDGIALYDTDGYIGMYGQGNTIRNNTRSGIGLNSFDGSEAKPGPEIAYNRIYSNEAFGIGSLGLTNMNATINNNKIYSNHRGANNTLGPGGGDIGGGIGLNNFKVLALIDNNTIRNNRGSSGGGVGITASNGTFSLNNNLIMDNVSSIVGGIGFTNLTGAMVYLQTNKIASNTGDNIGALGVSISNGGSIFTFINNQIMNNIGSGWDKNLQNVGGAGFQGIADGSIYLSGNTLRQNWAFAEYTGSDRGRVGALGVSDSNADINFVANTVGNNDGRCIGGVGFDTYNGDATVSSNLIYGNVNNKSSWGAGGLAFDELSGTVTVLNNKIYNNTNTATGSGGMGFNALQAVASVQVEGNYIYNNSGMRAGGIGIANPLTSDVTITFNNIYSNYQFGLGILNGSFLNIVDNTISNNGLDKTQVGDEFYASGMQLRSSTFNNNDITGNTLENNRFAGIQARNSAGTVGPNNVIRYNGEDVGGGGGSCSGVGGDGRGGVSARDLTAAMGNLYLVGNNITQNTTLNVQHRPGSTADLYEDGAKVTSTLLTDAMVVVYVTSDTLINNATIEGGDVWGIAAVGPYNVTITNSTIRNNCTNNVDCNLNGDNGKVGGGILIAGGANVSMDNNLIYNNGFSAQIEGEGGIAGVAIRCAESTTTLINNTIESNANDGIVLYDTKGHIGLSGEGNIIRRNRRHGVGVSSFAAGGVVDEGVEIAYNDIYSNTAFGVGSYNLTNMNASINNNTIYDNHTTNSLGVGGTDIGGGIGINGLSSLAMIEGNTIRNNPGSTTGGIGFTAADGEVTITNNVIYGNDSTSSGAGGIGLADLGANASVLVAGNSLYDNTGVLISGIGVTNANATASVSILQNDIFSNLQSGIGINASSNIAIQDNLVASCGLADGNNSASGIILRDSTFAYNDLSNNVIRGNLYAGILAYNTVGSIGPGNDIEDNGNSAGGGTGCARLLGPGSGDGGIAARYLTGRLDLNDNFIENNNSASITRPDCGGDVYVNGATFSNCGGGFTASDVALYIDSTTTVNCEGGSLSGGLIWGVAIMGAAKDVTITNCTIENNMTQANSMGGGIMVGPNAEAYIYNNVIQNNGTGVAAEGSGGIAGVVLRCADPNTEVFDNTITGNSSDGINVGYSAGTIGKAGQPNLISSNGRNGIGVNNYGGGSAIIQYNTIYNNTNARGIGIVGNADVSILNNEIYGQTNSTKGQGIGLGGGNANSGSVSSSPGNTATLGSGSATDDTYTGMILETSDGDPKYALIIDYDGSTKTATINQNWVSGSEPSGTYVVYTAAMATAYVANNTIRNNAQGVAMKLAAPGSDIHVYNNNIYLNSGGPGAGGVGVTAGLTGAEILIENNSINNNTGGTGKPGGIGISTSSGTINFSNNSIVNNSGLGAGFQGLLDGADVLIFSNVIDGSTGSSVVGGVGIEDLRDGAYIDVNGNSITNNSTSSKTGGLGIRQTSAYGSYGFVRVSNNYFDNNGSGGSRTHVIGIGDTNISQKVTLTSVTSGIEIIRNTINCNNVMSGIGLVDIASGNDSTRFGRVYFRENSIYGADTTNNSDNFGIRGSDAAGSLGAGSTDYVSLFIQNNRNVDGGMAFGSGNGPEMYFGEVRISGNTLRNISTTSTNPEAAIVFNNAVWYYPIGTATFHFSGNVLDNLNSGAMWLYGHAGAMDGRALHMYVDSNLYSTCGPIFWQWDSGMRNFFMRDNKGRHVAYHTNTKNADQAGLLSLDSGMLEVQKLYFIGNDVHDSKTTAWGTHGKACGIGDKLVYANNTIVSTGYPGFGWNGNGAVPTNGYHFIGNTFAKNNLTAHGGGGAAVNYGDAKAVAGGDFYFRNNLAFNNGNMPVFYTAGASNTYVEHNTFVDNDGAPLSVAGEVAAGNLFLNDPVSGGTTASSGDFQNYTGSGWSSAKDIHLSTGAAAGVKDGLGSSAFSDNFDLDIEGLDRPAGSGWAYGADEEGTGTYDIPVIDSVIASQTRDGLQVVNINYNGSDPTDDAIHSEIYYTRPGPGLGYDRGCAYSFVNRGEWLALEDILVWTNTRAYFPTSAKNMTFPWLVRRELPMIEERAQVRLQANDWNNDSALAYSNIFTIDTMPPRNLANLHQIDATTDKITLAWTPAEDANFLTYKICYDTSGTSLGNLCSGFIKDSAGYEALGTATTDSIVVSNEGFTANTAYAFNIFAYDAYGHVIAAYDTSTDLSTSGSGSGGGANPRIMVNTTTTQVPANQVLKGGNEGLYAFKLYFTGAGAVEVNSIEFTNGSGNTASYGSGNDYQNCYLREDAGTLGSFNASEDTTTISNISGASMPISASGLTESINNAGKYYIVTCDINSGATTGADIVMALQSSVNNGIVIGSANVELNDYPVDGNVHDIAVSEALSVSTPNQVPTGDVVIGNPNAAIYAFQVDSGSGTIVIDDVNLTYGTGNQAVYNSNVKNARLYWDNGSNVGQYDSGEDAFLADFSFNAGNNHLYIENLGDSIIGTRNYLVTLEIVSGAENDIVLALQASDHSTNPGISVDWPDTVTTFSSPIDGNTQTIKAVTTSPELQDDAGNATAQRSGTGLVDVNYQGRDAGFDTVTYVASGCEYSLDSTDGSNGTWNQMTNGGLPYADFESEWSSHTFVWNAVADTNVEDNQVFVRILVDDGVYTDSWTELTSFALDTKAPGTPGTLGASGVTPYTIPLSWTASSVDINWDQYEIYFKPCDGCAIDRNDPGLSLKAIPGGPSITNTTLTSTDNGIQPSTTYRMNIWAVDTFENVAPAASEYQVTTGDLLNVGQNGAQPSGSVEQGQSNSGVVMQKIQLTAGANTVTVDSLKVQQTGTATASDIAWVEFHDDPNNDGVPDSLIGTTTEAAGEYSTATGLGYVVTAGTTSNVLVLVKAADAANTVNNITMSLQSGNVGVLTPDAAVETAFSGGTFGITGNSLTPFKPSQPTAVELTPSETDRVVMKLGYTASYGYVDIDALTLKQIGTDTGTSIAKVKLYEDDDGDGIIDPEDSLLYSDTSVTAGEYDFTISPAFRVTAGTNSYMQVAIDTAGTLEDQTTVQFQLENSSKVTVSAPDSVLGTNLPFASNAFTTPSAGPTSDRLTVSIGAEITDSSTVMNATNVALLAFTAQETLGGGDGTVTINSVTLDQLAGNSTDFVANSMKLYTDNGTAGTYEPGTDTPVIGTYFTYTGGIWQLTGLTESVNSTAKDYIVVADLAAPEGGTIKLQLRDSAASPKGVVIDTGSGDTVVNPGDPGPTININKDALTVDDFAGQIGNSTVAPSDTNVELVRFRLTSDGAGDDSVTVTQVNLSKVGTWSEADIATGTMKLYVDHPTLGTLGVYDSSFDAQVGTTFTWNTDHWELTGINETVSGTQHYLVVANIDSLATTEDIQVQLNASGSSPAGVVINPSTGNLTAHTAFPGGVITIQSAAPPVSNTGPPQPPCYPDPSYTEPCHEGLAPPAPPCDADPSSTEPCGL